jgi:hypothetical protein
MALGKCPACNHDLSREAKACPNCGQPLNFPRQRNSLREWGILILALLVGVAIFSTTPKSDDNSRTSTDTACKTDWAKCADNSEMANHFEGWTRAQDLCQRAANEQARYGTTTVWPWVAFGRFRRGTDYVNSGIAVLIERDAQFQNGFGAMVHSEVVCTYDLRAEKVTNISISPPIGPAGTHVFEPN